MQIVYFNCVYLPMTMQSLEVYVGNTDANSRNH